MMNSWLLVLAFAATPVENYDSIEVAADELSGQFETGMLLFSEGDCVAVKAFTGSPYTHVAGVVVENGETFVFDSQNGVGVRRLPLEEYLAAVHPDGLHVLRPAKPFDEASANAFRSHCESQIGRPYAVRHHLTGERCEGLHCAEFMTDALAAADVARAERPPRVSPSSLRKGLLRHGLYVETRRIVVEDSGPEREPGRNWCSELWLDTKDCCAACWLGFRRRVLCR